MTIADLKRLGYFCPDRTISSVLNWGSGRWSRGPIQVTADVKEQYVDLAYTHHDKAIRYRIRLESVARHFGGCELYFLCPATGQRCKKLYGIGEYFLSRHAFPSAMYRQQAASKSKRSFYAAVRVFDLQMNFFNRRYVHTTYRGQPTKAYLRRVNERNRLGVRLCDHLASRESQKKSSKMVRRSPEMSSNGDLEQKSREALRDKRQVH